MHMDIKLRILNWKREKSKLFYNNIIDKNFILNAKDKKFL